jgi:hypothetical protein
MSNTNGPEPGPHSSRREQRQRAKPPRETDVARKIVNTVVSIMVLTVACATGVGFWLSYGGLHTFALHAGLRGAEAWAWPSSVDLFIAAGEAGWTVSALRGRKDWAAVIYLASGVLVSVAGNVLHVDLAHLTWIKYPVAAIPPLAAMMALAALLRTAYQLVIGRAEEQALPVPGAGERKPTEPLPPQPSARQGHPGPRTRVRVVHLNDQPRGFPALVAEAADDDGLTDDQRARKMVTASLDAGFKPSAREIAREGLRAPGRRRAAQALIDEAIALTGNHLAPTLTAQNGAST